MATQPNTARFLGYLRRSTDHQEQSLDGQREACQKEAARRGGQIAVEDFFLDDAITGSDLERPGLKALLGACKTRTDVSGVIIWDRSRLARAEDPREALALELHIEKTGRKLIYVNSSSPNDGSIASHIVALIESESAGKYLLDLSRNVLRGLLQAVHAGHLDGRVPPYGYDTLYVDSSGKPLFIARYNPDRSKEIHEAKLHNETTSLGRHVRSLKSHERPPRSRQDTATLIQGDPFKHKVVRQMFDWAATERLGYKTIARRLNERHVPSPSGGRWAIGSVRDILINPVYRGAYRWNYRSKAKFFHSTKEGLSRVGERAGKGLVRNPEKDVIIKENIFPALVPAEAWFSAQAARQSRQQRIFRGKAANAVYLASGLAYCHNGHKLQGFTTSSRGHRYHAYRCYERYLSGTSGCQAPIVRREQVDDAVLHWLREACILPLLRESDTWAVFEKTLRDSDQHPAELEALRQRAADIDRFITRIGETLDENNLALLDRKLTRLRQERDAINARLNAAQAHTMSLDEVRQKAREFLDDAGRILDDGSPQELKDLLRCFIYRIEVDPIAGKGRIIYYRPHAALQNRLCIQMERVTGIEPV